MRKENNKRYTDYYTVTKTYLENKILCNQIAEIDPSVYDNMHFGLLDSEGCPVEIYQFFITDCNKDDVKFLEESFGLLFSFSDALDCYILCVNHFGTLWNGVEVEVTNDDISDDDIIRNEKKWR